MDKATDQPKIEHGVPHPGRNHYGARWPFDGMQAGDSFVVGFEDKKSLRIFYTTANRWGKRHGVKLSIRKISDGQYRCWRIK